MEGRRALKGGRSRVQQQVSIPSYLQTTLGRNELPRSPTKQGTSFEEFDSSGETRLPDRARSNMKRTSTLVCART